MLGGRVADRVGPQGGVTGPGQPVATNHSAARPNVQVDVFTERIFGGNPLAVMLDGRGLANTEMQDIAREMNLAETTFVFPTSTCG